MWRLTICLLIFISSQYCCGFRERPDFEGVDPRTTTYVDEFYRQADLRDIRFQHKISIGFQKLKDDNELAECREYKTFKEIVINSNRWNRLDEITRLMTLFHELGHYSCGRDHDFNGLRYPEIKDLMAPEVLPHRKNHRLGYFLDGCPQSLMYPIIVDDTCSMPHYQEYLEELFRNCKPY